MEQGLLLRAESYPIIGILDCFVILPRNDKQTEPLYPYLLRLKRSLRLPLS